MKDNLLPAVASNVITAAGSLSGDPTITLSTAFLAPIAVSVVKDLASRMLSSFQSSRLESACTDISIKFQNRLQNGEKYRNDSVMNENNGEEARQLLEGILINIQDEFEKKKIDAHTNLFTNFCFDEMFAYEQAIYISRLLKQLSYRQLCIMAYSFNTNIDCGALKIKFKDTYAFDNYSDFYSEILYLESIEILQQANRGFSLSGSGPLKLGALGKIIYKEAGLSSIPLEDINPIEYLIKQVLNRS